MYEQTVAETHGKGTEEYKARMIKSTKTGRLKTQNERPNKVEAQAIKLRLGVARMLEDLNRRRSNTSFGGNIVNFVKMCLQIRLTLLTG